jgi:hypothetical protein
LIMMNAATSDQSIERPVKRYVPPIGHPTTARASPGLSLKQPR